MNSVEFYMNLFGWRNGSSSPEGLYFVAAIMLHHDVTRVTRSDIKKLGGFTRLPGCLSGMNPSTSYSQNARTQSPILDVVKVIREGREYIFELDREAITDRVIGKLFWYTRLFYGKKLELPDVDRPLIRLGQQEDPDMAAVFCRLGDPTATTCMLLPGKVLVTDNVYDTVNEARSASYLLRTVHPTALHPQGGQESIGRLFQELFAPAANLDWDQCRANGGRWTPERSYIPIETIEALSLNNKIRALLLWEFTWQFHRLSIFDIHQLSFTEEELETINSTKGRILDPTGNHTVSRIIEVTLLRCR